MTTLTRLSRIARWEKKMHRFFPMSISVPTLYEALLTIKQRACRFAERACNEPMSEAFVAREEKRIFDAIDALIGFRALGVRVEIDDPRGVVLKIPKASANKIDPDHDLPRDFGGEDIDLVPIFD